MEGFSLLKVQKLSYCAEKNTCETAKRGKTILSSTEESTEFVLERAIHSPL